VLPEKTWQNRLEKKQRNCAACPAASVEKEQELILAMEKGQKQPTASQQLELWTQRVAECRSSGMQVKTWCQTHGVSKKTYYYWQRRVLGLLQNEEVQEQQPEFAEIPLHPQSCSSAVTASLDVAGVSVQVFAGADEQTLCALLRALKAC